jgi:putative transposase
MNKARESGKTLRTYDTQNLIPLLKTENPNLSKVYSKVLQMVNYTLWSNIKGLSALKMNGRKVGHLRFKGKGWYNTLNYNQSGFKLDQDHSILKLSKIGEIKIKLHRKVEGNIKAVLIKRAGDRWFALIQAEQEPKRLSETGNAVGLDVGLTSFVVDSDGNSVENPRFQEKAATKVKNIQRKLPRAQKGSNNRRKLVDKLEKAHERINNQRADFLHKLSRMYVNRYDIICAEDLDVKYLKEKGNNKGIHRNIHDASWSRFMFMLSYKAQSAGRKLIVVDPRSTSQWCSFCGSIVRKELSDRVHECPYCGFSSNRDYNAALNILSTGMEQPVAPIESKPLHHVSVMQVLAMKWEALPFRVG